MNVSVVINVYNGSAFIAQTIESVLAQTMRKFELVVVDDGSTDATVDIVRQYAARDSRIVLIQQPNQGIAVAMNRGIMEAKHEWIAHIDADDLMLPTRLERQLEYLQTHPDVSVLGTFAAMINRDGKRVGYSTNEIDTERAMRLNRVDLALDLVHSSVIMLKAAVQAVGGYPSGLMGIEERELWSLLITSGYKVAVLPEVLTEYRLLDTSITSTRAKVIDQKGDFINQNFLRRAAGQAQLTWEEFQQSLSERSLIARITAWRTTHARIHYLNAIRFYAAARWIPCVKHTFMAVGLRPISMSKLVLNRLRRRESPAV